MYQKRDLRLQSSKIDLIPVLESLEYIFHDPHVSKIQTSSQKVVARQPKGINGQPIK